MLNLHQSTIADEPWLRDTRPISGNIISSKVAQSAIVTRFIHDQFAKQYLNEMLSSFGTVETSKDVVSEVRQVDVFF
ncbi:hypothetical protein PJF56_15405, partial [Roseofilum sp. BLCC_M91]|nr:hypothetical protein [Roseofilum halophilum BLCC-M91]